MRNLAFRRPHSHAGPNMTPLVDVVMVLLIFLMMVGDFASGEHFLAGRTPGGASGAGAPAGSGRRLDVYVNCRSGGGFAARVAGMGTVRDVGALRDALAGERYRLAEGGAGADSVLVVIHPAADSSWGAAAGAYDAAVRAGFRRVAFAYAK